MFKNLSKTDQFILGLAIIAMGLSSFLLYDDSLLYSFTGGKQRAAIGTVAEAERDVRHKSVDQIVWNQADLKEKIHQGDSIFTGPNSKTTVVLDDGSKITLAENSFVMFNFQGSELQLDLKFGRVQSQLTQNSKLKVNSGCDALEVSGSQAVVDIGADCTVNTISGQANVTSKKGLVKKDAPKPQKRKVASTFIEKPTLKFAPSPIITTPAVEETLTFKAQEEPQVQFSWDSPLEKAKYEVQVASDSQFGTPLKNYVSTRKEVNTKDFPPGSYYVRARSLAGNGYLDSEWSSTVPFKIDQLQPVAKPKAPVLITRQLEAMAQAKDKPVAEWSAEPEMKSFTIEMSNDLEFNKIEAASVDQLKIKLPIGKTGRTYFRVRAVSKDDLESENSEVGVLTVKTTTPVLNPIDPKVAYATTPEDKGPPADFNVTWSESPGTASYQVELSQSKEFAEVKRFESRNPASLVTVSQTGDYFVRVRALGPQGEAVSEFSQPGEISYTLKSLLATPELTKPTNNITLFFQKNTESYEWLQWNTVKDASSYRLEVALEPDFTKILFSKELKETQFQLTQKIPSGKVYWRVQALGDNQAVSSWSDPRTLNFISGRGLANTQE